MTTGGCEPAHELVAAGVDSITTNQKVGSFGVTLDGAGSVLSTGQKGYITIPYNCTITGWAITADGSSPTCTFDIWKIATGTALPTVSNTIMGTKPALSTGNAKQSTTLTSWSVAITAFDIIGFNLDAVAVATKISLIIEVAKT